MGTRILRTTALAAFTSFIGYVLVHQAKSRTRKRRCDEPQFAMERWETEGGAAPATRVIFWSERDRRMGPG